MDISVKLFSVSENGKDLTFLHFCSNNLEFNKEKEQRKIETQLTNWGAKHKWSRECGIKQ